MFKTMFFPAIFKLETNGGYSVAFPDIPECLTQGDTLEEAYKMSFEALGLVLSYKEDNKLEIPTPSEPKNIKTDCNQTVVLIPFNMIEYKKI